MAGIYYNIIICPPQPDLTFRGCFRAYTFDCWK